VRIEDIQMQNDATTAGVWTLGIYLNDNQGLNVNAPSGPLGTIQTWNSTTAYVPGNVVQYANVIYYCITGNTNSQPPSANWTTGLSTNIPASSIPIPNAQLIFGTGISTAAANTVWKSIYAPTVGAVAQTASNTGLRVWELAGFTQDPFYEFHLCMTSTTAPTANGNIALQYSWLR
jgi:hypothetical protein